MLKGYPRDADITLIDTIYQYPQRQDDGKYSEDKMMVLFKDNVTGEKKLEEIVNPTYVFYKANDEVVLEHNLFFIEKENVHEIEVPFKDLLKTIAEETGNLDFFFENIRNRNRRANNQLHTLPEIFNSDINIEDHYRFRFDKYYNNRSIPITKAYFDIEADTINMAGDFPEMGECPINAVSYVDIESMNVHTFLLRNENNPLIQEFEDGVGPELFEKLRNFIIEHVGGPKFANKHNILDLKFNIYFYDEEIDMLKDFFKLVNLRRPDFLLAWNMSFDIPYIIERIKILGYDPADIMCPADVETKIAKYYIDVDNQNFPSERGDYFTISGFTIYLDQLVHFASRRKGQSAFDNFKLDYIGEVISGVNKLDYSHITRNIAKLPYKNYLVFVFYNIMDTIVQQCIENRVNDIGYIYNKCLLNNTRYHKGHRQTVYLTNRGVKEFEMNGYIMGNNINRGNEKPPKFPGALVGDPLNNNDYSKIKINGRAINVADNADDFDYKGLYPNTMRQNNIAPNTQIGIIRIDQVVHGNENPFNYDKYTRGGQFVQDFMSGNYLVFCRRWLHLGGYMEVMEDLREFFETNIPYGEMDILNPKSNKVHTIKQIDSMITFNPYNITDTMITCQPNERSFVDDIEMIKATAQMDMNSIEQIMRRKEREREEDEELNKIFMLKGDLYDDSEGE